MVKALNQAVSKLSLTHDHDCVSDVNSSAAVWLKRKLIVDVAILSVSIWSSIISVRAKSLFNFLDFRFSGVLLSRLLKAWFSHRGGCFAVVYYYWLHPNHEDAL